MNNNRCRLCGDPTTAGEYYCPKCAVQFKHSFLQPPTISGGNNPNKKKNQGPSRTRSTAHIQLKPPSRTGGMSAARNRNISHIRQSQGGGRGNRSGTSFRSFQSSRTNRGNAGSYDFSRMGTTNINNPSYSQSGWMLDESNEESDYSNNPIGGISPPPPKSKSGSLESMPALESGPRTREYIPMRVQPRDRELSVSGSQAGGFNDDVYTQAESKTEQENFELICNARIKAKKKKKKVSEWPDNPLHMKPAQMAEFATWVGNTDTTSPISFHRCADELSTFILTGGGPGRPVRDCARWCELIDKCDHLLDEQQGKQMADCIRWLRTQFRVHGYADRYHRYLRNRDNWLQHLHKWYCLPYAVRALVGKKPVVKLTINNKDKFVRVAKNVLVASITCGSYGNRHSDLVSDQLARASQKLELALKLLQFTWTGVNEMENNLKLFRTLGLDQTRMRGICTVANKLVWTAGDVMNCLSLIAQTFIKTRNQIDSEDKCDGICIIVAGHAGCTPNSLRLSDGSELTVTFVHHFFTRWLDKESEVFRHVPFTIFFECLSEQLPDTVMYRRRDRMPWVDEAADEEAFNEMKQHVDGEEEEDDGIIPMDKDQFLYAFRSALEKRYAAAQSADQQADDMDGTIQCIAALFRGGWIRYGWRGFHHVQRNTNDKDEGLTIYQLYKDMFSKKMDMHKRNQCVRRMAGMILEGGIEEIKDWVKNNTRGTLTEYVGGQEDGGPYQHYIRDQFVLSYRFWVQKQQQKMGGRRAKKKAEKLLTEFATNQDIWVPISDSILMMIRDIHRDIINMRTNTETRTFSVTNDWNNILRNVNNYYTRHRGLVLDNAFLTQVVQHQTKSINGLGFYSQHGDGLSPDENLLVITCIWKEWSANHRFFFYRPFLDLLLEACKWNKKYESDNIRPNLNHWPSWFTVMKKFRDSIPRRKATIRVSAPSPKMEYIKVVPGPRWRDKAADYEKMFGSGSLLPKKFKGRWGKGEKSRNIRPGTALPSGFGTDGNSGLLAQSHHWTDRARIKNLLKGDIILYKPYTTSPATAAMITRVEKDLTGRWLHIQYDLGGKPQTQRIPDTSRNISLPPMHYRRTALYDNSGNEDPYDSARFRSRYQPNYDENSESDQNLYHRNDNNDNNDGDDREDGLLDGMLEDVLRMPSFNVDNEEMIIYDEEKNIEEDEDQEDEKDEWMTLGNLPLTHVSSHQAEESKTNYKQNRRDDPEMLDAFNYDTLIMPNRKHKERGGLFYQTQWYDKKVDSLQPYKVKLLFGDHVQEKTRAQGTERGTGHMAGQAQFCGKWDRAHCWGITTAWDGAYGRIDPGDQVFNKTMDVDFRPLEALIKQGFDIVVPKRPRPFYDRRNSKEIFHNMGTNRSAITPQHIAQIQERLDTLRDLASFCVTVKYYQDYLLAKQMRDGTDDNDGNNND